jgi:hypothetical protein
VGNDVRRIRQHTQTPGEPSCRDSLTPAEYRPRTEHAVSMMFNRNGRIEEGGGSS